MKIPILSQIVCFFLVVLLGASSIIPNQEGYLSHQNSISSGIVDNQLVCCLGFESRCQTSLEEAEGRGCCEGNSNSIESINYFRRVIRNQKQKYLSDFFSQQKKIDHYPSSAIKPFTHPLAALKKSNSGLGLFLIFRQLLN